jgi:phosphoesterase RecJ-like protein
MTPSAVASFFRETDNLLLLIHHSPDGDAIASSLALCLALRSLGKTVDVACADPIPKQFLYLPLAHLIQHDFFIGDYRAIVTLDCGDSKRTGFKLRLKQLGKGNRARIINIDHHPKNDLHSLAHINYVDLSAPSTSFLVNKVIQSLGVAIDHKIATCLLTGLYTDTGGFKHPNTTPEALNFASLLLRHGARLKDITSNISQPSTVNRLKLWGVALSRIKQHRDFNLISTYLTQDDIALMGAEEHDIAGIAALLSTISADMTVLMVEQSDKSIQVRMRTKNREVNVAGLAKYLGGGGQRKAAGFTVRSQFIFI